MTMQARRFLSLPILLAAAAAAAAPTIQSAAAQGEPAAASSELQRASAKLALEGDPSALSKLARSGDAKAEERMRALRARWQGDGDDEVIRAVVRQWVKLNGPGADRELKWIGDRALPYLVEEFQKSSSDIALAGRIAKRILDSNSEAAARWLNGVFENEKGLRRALVIRSLRLTSRSTPAMREAVLRFAKDPDASLRRDLVTRAGLDASPELMRAFLLDEDDRVKIAALSVLSGYCGRRDGGPGFVNTRSGRGARPSYPQSWSRRFKSVLPALRELARRDLAAPVREVFGQILGSSQLHVLIHDARFEAARDCVLDLLSKLEFRSAGMQASVDPSDFYHEIGVEQLLSAFRAGRKNGVDNRHVILDYLAKAVRSMDESSMRAYLTLAAEWGDKGAFLGNRVSQVIERAWARISEILRVEDLPTLAQRIGGPLLPEAKTIAKLIDKRSWHAQIREGLWRRVRAGDFKGRSKIASPVMRMLFTSMSDADLRESVDYYASSKSASIYYELIRAFPMRKSAVQELERLAAMAPRERGAEHLRTRAFEKLLLLAPAGGTAALEALVQLPMGQRNFEHFPTLRRQQQSSSKVYLTPLGALTALTTEGRWAHSLRHDVVAKYCRLLLESARASGTDALRELWTSVFGFVRSGEDVRGWHFVMPEEVLPCFDALSRDAQLAEEIQRRAMSVVAGNLGRLPDAKKIFQRILDAGDYGTIRGACSSLARFDRVSRELALVALPALVQQQQSVRRSARAILKPHASVREVLDFVEAASKREKSYERLGSIEFAGFVGGKPYLAIARRALEDADSGVRMRAAQVFQTHLDVSSVDALLPLLRDRNDAVRKAAKSALDALRYAQEQESHWKQWASKRGQPSLAAALFEQADEKQPDEIRVVAIRSLGMVGDVEALPYLIDLMKSQNTKIAEAAKEAVALLQKVALRKLESGTVKQKASKK